MCRQNPVCGGDKEKTLKKLEILFTELETTKENVKTLSAENEELRQKNSDQEVVIKELNKTVKVINANISCT